LNSVPPIINAAARQGFKEQGGSSEGAAPIMGASKHVAAAANFSTY
jgi:hypothetical protein